MLVREWLAPVGRIARRLPEFEPRPQQVAMAEAVAAAFHAGRHLAVEAGTGVGKTFAYLLPAIEQILTHGRRVVVSTHTIALQEQLIRKDVPFLQDALGEPFRAELVKGRQNYVSLRRLQGLSEKQNTLLPGLFLRQALHVVEDWAYTTEDGSLASLPQQPPLEVWEKVRSEHNNCLGRRCPTYDVCFYQRARRRAAEAQLLVVNHALLMSDLLLRRSGVSVLPDYELLVIDEAHTLEGVAVEQLGVSVSAGQVQHVLAGLFNERTGKGLLATLGTDAHRHAVVAAQRAAAQLFDALADWHRRHGRANGRLVAPPPVTNELSPALERLAAALGPLQRELPREQDRYELGAAAARAAALAAQVHALLAQTAAEQVYWIEDGAAPRPGGAARGEASSRLGGDAARRIALCAAPLDVAGVLHELLFARLPSVVLTSATLAADNDDRFEYLLGRLGVLPPPGRPAASETGGAPAGRRTRRRRRAARRPESPRCGSARRSTSSGKSRCTLRPACRTRRPRSSRRRPVARLRTTCGKRRGGRSCCSPATGCSTRASASCGPIWPPRATRCWRKGRSSRRRNCSRSSASRRARRCSAPIVSGRGWTWSVRPSRTSSLSSCPSRRPTGRPSRPASISCGAAAATRSTTISCRRRCFGSGRGSGG